VREVTGESVDAIAVDGGHADFLVEVSEHGAVAAACGAQGARSTRSRHATSTSEALRRSTSSLGEPLARHGVRTVRRHVLTGEALELERR
jgi:hypothetical protein